MKLLLVSATLDEIRPLVEFFTFKEGLNLKNSHEITVLVGGVGMVSMAFSLGKALGQHSYDLALNAGIAGSFNRSLKPGDVVAVSSDSFSELGAEDGPAFLSIEQMGFGKSTFTPVPSILTNKLAGDLPTVSAITVNTVHGNESSILQTVNKLNPDIETMEGASFFYACSQENIPSIQVRAISNYVEPRNRASWNIPFAVNNLNLTLVEILKKIL